MALKDTFLGCELRQAPNISAADSHITFELTNPRRKEKQKQVEKNLTRERIKKKSKSSFGAALLCSYGHLSKCFQLVIE